MMIMCRWLFCCEFMKTVSLLCLGTLFNSMHPGPLDLTSFLSPFLRFSLSFMCRGCIIGVLIEVEHHTVIYSHHFDQLWISVTDCIFCKKKHLWWWAIKCLPMGIKINICNRVRNYIDWGKWKGKGLESITSSSKGSSVSLQYRHNVPLVEWALYPTTLLSFTSKMTLPLLHYCGYVN